MRLLGAFRRAGGEPVSDLRGVTIGMLAQDLPASGYRNLSCVGGTSQPLEDWSAWKSCPVDPDGLRRVHVDYDQLGQDATMVAGHPVDLTVFFDDSGRLVRIETKRKIRRASTCARKLISSRGRRWSTMAMMGGVAATRRRALTRKPSGGPTSMNMLEGVWEALDRGEQPLLSQSQRRAA